MDRVEVLSSFLKDDGTHLNLLGYEALINDITLVMSVLWGKKTGGRMWSAKRIKRKRFFCSLAKSKRQRLY